MSAANAPSAGEYIGHHLKHLQNKEMSGVIDFSVFNIDSIFWGILLGVLGSFFLWKAASKATSGVPGRFQAAVEIFPSFKILVILAENRFKKICNFLIEFSQAYK